MKLRRPREEHAKVEFCRLRRVPLHMLCEKEAGACRYASSTALFRRDATASYAASLRARHSSHAFLPSHRYAPQVITSHASFITMLRRHVTRA